MHPPPSPNTTTTSFDPTKPYNDPDTTRDGTLWQRSSFDDGVFVPWKIFLLLRRRCLRALVAIHDDATPSDSFETLVRVMERPRYECPNGHCVCKRAFCGHQLLFSWSSLSSSEARNTVMLSSWGETATSSSSSSSSFLSNASSWDSIDTATGTSPSCWLVLDVEMVVFCTCIAPVVVASLEEAIQGR